MDSRDTSEAPHSDNPTRAFVADAVAAGRRNVTLGVNPALAILSTTLVESRDGELVLRFTAPPSATQGNGVVSGGTIASMLDLAMAMAVLARLKPGFTCATVNLTVNIQNAGEEGDFVAVAGVDRIGRQVGYAHARLYGPDGERLIASAMSSLLVMPVR